MVGQVSKKGTMNQGCFGQGEDSFFLLLRTRDGIGNDIALDNCEFVSKTIKAVFH